MKTTDIVEINRTTTHPINALSDEERIKSIYYWDELYKELLINK